MKIQFDAGMMLIELVSSKNTGEAGSFELYFKEIDSRRGESGEPVDSNLCPKSTIWMLKDYFFRFGSWPLEPEMVLQRLEEEEGVWFGPEEEREIAASWIRQMIDVQNQVRSLYIANMPKEVYFLSYDFIEILSLLKELQSVQVCENESGYFSEDGILYVTVGEGYVDSLEYRTSLVFCPPASPLTEIRLNPSVQVISSRAFMGNKNLVQLETESQDLKIIHFAFRWARSLETVKIGAERIEIVDRAFGCCPPLKHFIIRRDSMIHCPDTAFDPEKPFYQALLTEWIEDSGYKGDPGDIAAFGRCGDTAWRYKDRENTEHVIGQGEMWDYDDLFYMKQSPDFESSNLVIHDGITAIGVSAFMQRQFGTIIFAASVREIRELAFCEISCDALILPGTIKHLRKYAFYWDECYIKRVEISSAIEQIGECALHSRYGGPAEVVLTGDKPPKDWIMWMRSDLMIDEGTVVYFPEKWRDVMTPEYFESIRKDKRMLCLPEDSESYYDYILEDRIAFVDEMEKALCREDNTGRYRWK